MAELKEWDKASDDIKLGAIGILVKDEKGKIKTQKLGSRAGGKGARTGIILGVIAAILSGGVTLLGGVVVGAVGGGIFGSLFHRGLGLSKDQLNGIGKELDSGEAAVGVMAVARRSVRGVGEAEGPWRQASELRGIGRGCAAGHPGRRGQAAEAPADRGASRAGLAAPGSWAPNRRPG